MLQLLLILLALFHVNHGVENQVVMVYYGDLALFKTSNILDSFFNKFKYKNTDIYADDDFVFELEDTLLSDVIERYKYIPGMEPYLTNGEITLRNFLKEYGGWNFFTFGEATAIVWEYNLSVDHIENFNNPIYLNTFPIMVPLLYPTTTKVMYVDINANTNYELDEESFTLPKEVEFKPLLMLNSRIATIANFEAALESSTSHTIAFNFKYYLTYGGSPICKRLVYEVLPPLTPNIRRIKSVEGVSLYKIFKNYKINHVFNINNLNDNIYKELWKNTHPDLPTLTDKQLIALIDDHISKQVAIKLTDILIESRKNQLEIEENTFDNYFSMHKEFAVETLHTWLRANADVQNLITSKLEIESGFDATTTIEMSFNQYLLRDVREKQIRQYKELFKILYPNYHCPSVLRILHRKLYFFDDDIKVINEAFKYYNLRFRLTERSQTYVVPKGTIVEIEKGEHDVLTEADNDLEFRKQEADERNALLSDMEC